jgi:hypothetical protein
MLADTYLREILGTDKFRRYSAVQKASPATIKCHLETRAIENDP